MNLTEYAKFLLERFQVEHSDAKALAPKMHRIAIKLKPTDKLWVKSMEEIIKELYKRAKKK